jgi:hypothetical protein
MSLSREPFSPNTPPRKEDAIMRHKNVIEQSNIKLPPLGGIPTKFIFTSLPQSKGVKQVKKQNRDIHLLTMGISNKP